MSAWRDRGMVRNRGHLRRYIVRVSDSMYVERERDPRWLLAFYRGYKSARA